MSGRADHCLYKTEAEIAGIVGVDIAIWRANAAVLERSGLPLRDPLFARRRYWPAVKAFLDRRAGLDAPSMFAPDGEENFVNTGEASHGKRRTRARQAAAH